LGVRALRSSGTPWVCVWVSFTSAPKHPSYFHIAILGPPSCYVVGDKSRCYSKMHNGVRVSVRVCVRLCVCVLLMGRRPCATSVSVCVCVCASVSVLLCACVCPCVCSSVCVFFLMGRRPCATSVSVCVCARPFPFSCLLASMENCGGTAMFVSG
jgi:hypothetical protein